jgi:uncharacterized repeat protein (TIGR01451 family)
MARVLGCGPLLAAGVTIVTHGWNPVAGSGEPAWTGAMQAAISDNYLGGEEHFGTITITGVHGNLTATCSPWNVALASSTNGEIVIRVDWSAVADHFTSGVPAQEVAAAIAPKIYQGQGGAPPLAELPIHLVGHSRGGGMVCEIARLLGLQGVEVDQLTPLDPHPLTVADPQPVIPVVDTPVALYENVLFADSYWQDVDFPEGEYVTGAYNRLWSSLPGGYHNHPNPAYQDFADHLNIVLAYHATVDLASPTSNGEATLEAADRDAWFNDYETDGGVPGQRAGFYYSLIAGQSDRLSTDTPVPGGDQVVDGFQDDPLLGGDGARSALTWTAATWPNLVVLQVLEGGSPLGAGTHELSPGDPLNVRYVLRDFDSSSQVTLTFDADRNPYNANSIATVGTVNHGATGSALVEQTVAWDTGSLPGNVSGYVCGRISDGSRTRYLCAQPELHTLLPEADLAVTKTDGLVATMPGAQVTYTITVSNDGPAATASAGVDDPFPGDLTSVTWTCAGTGGGTCSATGSGDIHDTAALPIGATVTYTAIGTVAADASGTMTNTVTVAATDTSDPDPSDNSASDETIVSAELLFANGFETGSTSAWDATTP